MVAKIVMQAAAKHLTPVLLELGGKRLEKNWLLLSLTNYVLLTIGLLGDKFP